jgi:hypothetical protein
MVDSGGSEPGEPLASCPKCSGLLYTGNDKWGWYVSCWTCGWLQCLTVMRGSEAEWPLANRQGRSGKWDI